MQPEDRLQKIAAEMGHLRSSTIDLFESFTPEMLVTQRHIGHKRIIRGGAWFYYCWPRNPSLPDTERAVPCLMNEDSHLLSISSLAGLGMFTTQ
jgi:hypothetical protein